MFFKIMFNYSKAHLKLIFKVPYLKNGCRVKNPRRVIPKKLELEDLD
jgi:hypothetical protein